MAAFITFFQSVISGLSTLIFNNSMFQIIAMLSFGLIGGIFLLLFGSYVKEDNQSKKWPSVPGKIISARVQKGKVYVSHGYQTRYTPKITYSYSVNGAEYEGDRLGNGIFISRSRDSAKSWARKYPAHMVVTVYYNPDDPGKSVLEPVNSYNIFGVIAGGLLCLIAFFLGTLWLHNAWAGFLKIIGWH